MELHARLRPLYLTGKTSFDFDFEYAMTLCLRRIAPQSFLRVSRGLFILPGDLELPEPPKLLLYGDKNVTGMVGSYNLASHDGKFGSRPGCKLHPV